MKTLYIDLFSGISGDMFLGALIDLGVDSRALEHELKKLGVAGYHLHVKRAVKASISGIKFDVHVGDSHGHGHSHSHPHTHTRETDHDQLHPHTHGPTHEHQNSHSEAHEKEHTHDHVHHHTSFAEIRDLIQHSHLSAWVKKSAVAVFHRLALAEGKIHGLPPEEVGFHEVGAIDSIVDIVGACIGLEMLGNPRVLAGSVTEGTGWINCAHGRFPIPAPATLAILASRGVPVTQCEEPNELVTPTGAALLAEFVEEFGPMRNLKPAKIGFGLGTRDNRTRPNVLRAILGEAADATQSPHDWESDTVTVLETNLDDINPEILGNFLEKALTEGALDVFHTPVQMKKNRPGALLTVICAESDADRFSELMLIETSSFGVRRSVCERRKLTREFRVVRTQYGEVQVKYGKLDGKVLQAAPEYESCKHLAQSNGVPLKEIYAAAQKAIAGSAK